MRQEYDFILKNMKIGARGQVTIPKSIREQFGLGPEADVEFRVVSGSIILKKTPGKVNFGKWKGHCGKRFSAFSDSSVDKFIEDIRGR
jgi:AbrB family looped-hinge helix DNA binding protein